MHGRKHAAPAELALRDSTECAAHSNSWQSLRPERVFGGMQTLPHCRAWEVVCEGGLRVIGFWGLSKFGQL